MSSDTGVITETFDLDAYLRRIGHAGDRSATWSTLDAVIGAHTRTIAFENLTPFLGDPVAIDLPSVQHKLVGSGRGGYCFEQNLLLRAALLELGFSVRGPAARVLWGRPDDTVSPRSHMLLQVGADGERRIADVGFGVMTPTASIRLEPDTVQPTPHEDFRLVGLDGDHALQARVGGEWRTTYRFDLTEWLPVDYEAPNWYTSTSPRSHFVTGLIAARPTPDGRLLLNGRKLTTHRLDGPSEQRVFADAAELRTSLERDFQLRVPAGDDLERAFDRLP